MEKRNAASLNDILPDLMAVAIESMKDEASFFAFAETLGLMSI